MVSAFVDTPFTVTTTWTKTTNDVESLVFSSSRVVVYNPYSTGFNKYQSRIEFISILSNSVDPGYYTCGVSIESNSIYTFVNDSSNGNDSTTLQVIGKCLTNSFQ